MTVPSPGFGSAVNSHLQAIFNRRSVRKFSDRPVSDDVIRDLLEAAMAAPSAVGKDPWHFVVVRNPETLHRLANGLTNGRFLAQAGVGIAVCGQLSRAHDENFAYLLMDCSAATQNILLSASMLGLGACWLGVHPREDRIAHVETTLGLTPGIHPICLVAVGWPGQKSEPRTRYRDNAVHDESW